MAQTVDNGQENTKTTQVHDKVLFFFTYNAIFKQKIITTAHLCFVSRFYPYFG
jgi:hypothetical protein